MRPRSSRASYRSERRFERFHAGGRPHSGSRRRDIMAYYTYSEGFKAGSGENASVSTTIVDPEDHAEP